LQPNPVQAHYQLGLLLNRQGDYSEAAGEFEKASRGLPKKSAAIQNDMAVALYMAGRNDQAIQAYRDTLAIDSNFWQAHRNLGTALQKAGEFQEATASYEAALRLNPQAIDIYNDLANAHIRLKQRSQAAAALAQGLKLAQAAGDTANVRRFQAALEANEKSEK
jgi:tetratricopeptide (TPR) repeat protein